MNDSYLSVFLWELLLVKDGFFDVVQLHWAVKAVNQAKFEVWQLHASEHNRVVCFIELRVLGVHVLWQTVNLVNLILFEIKNENCGTLFVN